jgi:hypothetical protein
MNQTRRRLFLALAVATALCLCVPSPNAQAQQNCPSFHGLLQYQLLNPNLLFRDGDDWGGFITAYLGEEVLQGVGSGNDGAVTWHPHVGMGKDGSYFFDFGDGNTFTTTAKQGTFPNPPGHFPAGGMYQGTHKIASGTGRFTGATGNLLVRGPYLVWDLDKEVPQGRFNAEISGNICGVD